MTADDEVLDRLVAEARDGDPEAFAAIFDRFNQPVYRFIVSRINRPTDAEDLTQLVFVKALEALPRYESRGVPFGGWLFRLARNVLIDHVRTRRETSDLEVVLEKPDIERGPDEWAMARQDIEAVGAALASLTDEQRETIELRFFAGLSSKEVAVAMGKQEGTVRGLQFRAIAALRRRLGIEVDEREPVTTPPGAGGRRR
jgi:RNA polymerase sigma-70 factor (ECF subfamily)